MMLYLIRVFGRGNRSSLKIGWTKDIDKRMNQYYIHNPFFELISIRDGTEEDELKMHLYFTILGYKEDFLCEWFKDDSKVLTDFHKKIRKVEKTIWLSRDIIFRKEDYLNKLKIKIYQDLKERYKPQKLKDIDRVFLFESCKSEYKKLQKVIELDFLL